MKKISDYEMPPFLRDYLNYARTIKNKSENTVLSYFYDLRIFLRFILIYKKIIDKKIPFDEIDISIFSLDVLKSITLSDLYEYITFTSTNRSNSALGRARKISSIKSFFKYLTNKVNILSYNPSNELETPALRKSLPKFLNLNESIELLQSASGKYSQRDYAMLTLFLNCGLRLSELVGINISDIKNDTLRVIGKGNKERVIYLNDSCLNAIEEYKKIRKTDGVLDKDALFLSKQNKRIDKRMVQIIVKKYIGQSGLDINRYSTHKLRHTAATLMYRNGVDIRALQEILGHSNLGTTQIYTHLDDDLLRDAMKANPLSKVKLK